MIDGLSEPDQRQVCDLLFFQGLSVEEAAAAMGSSTPEEITRLRDNAAKNLFRHLPAEIGENPQREQHREIAHHRHPNAQGSDRTGGDEAPAMGRSEALTEAEADDTAPSSRADASAADAAYVRPHDSTGARQAGHATAQCGRLVLDLLDWLDPASIPAAGEIGLRGMLLRDVVRIAGADLGLVRRFAVESGRPYQGVADAFAVLPESQREGASILVFTGTDRDGGEGALGHVFRLVCRDGVVQVEDPGLGVSGPFGAMTGPGVIDPSGVWAVGFDRFGNSIELPGTKPALDELDLAVGLSADTHGDLVESVRQEADPDRVSLPSSVKTRFVSRLDGGGSGHFFPEILTTLIQNRGVDLVGQALARSHEGKHEVEFEKLPLPDPWTSSLDEYVESYVPYEARAFAQEAMDAAALEQRGYRVEKPEVYAVFGRAYDHAVDWMRRIRPDAHASELKDAGYRAGVAAIENFLTASAAADTWGYLQYAEEGWFATRESGLAPNLHTPTTAEQAREIRRQVLAKNAAYRDVAVLDRTIAREQEQLRLALLEPSSPAGDRRRAHATLQLRDLIAWRAATVREAAEHRTDLEKTVVRDVLHATLRQQQGRMLTDHVALVADGKPYLFVVAEETGHAELRAAALELHPEFAGLNSVFMSASSDANGAVQLAVVEEPRPRVEPTLPPNSTGWTWLNRLRHGACAGLGRCWAKP